MALFWKNGFWERYLSALSDDECGVVVVVLLIIVNIRKVGGILIILYLWLVEKEREGEGEDGGLKVGSM